MQSKSLSKKKSERLIKRVMDEAHLLRVSFKREFTS